MPVPRLARSADDRLIAGVCGGIAAALGVDANLVRFVFALLALAGGAGILLYFALWAWTSERSRIAPVLLLLAGLALLRGIGLRWTAVVAVAMIGIGLTLIWRRGGLRPGAAVPPVGVGLAMAGGVVLLTGGGTSVGFASPGAVAAALLLILGPWLWRLAVERDSERTARIRSEERADVAARVHDSVLQTLALIQRHAEEPRRIASLARRQERELRSWLYSDGTTAAGGTLSGALAAAASEVEELHGTRIELASGGDCELTDDLRPLVLAAREAMVNAAKFSGADEIDVYAEADATRATVIGFIALIIAVLLYYHGAGINAVLALLLNLVILLGMMAYFHATLTLPGIAGIILTLGMAVDSNVLVFERIREELRDGKAVRAAIENGFSRAFGTVIDTHLTTIIAALFLFQFGTGPIKGFAVTLLIGLGASVFTAFFVSRMIFDIVYKAQERPQAISI